MADLIGTATIRVDMNTAAAARSIRQFATQGNIQLRGLQSRITAVSREMARIGDRTIGVRVDDQTRAGVAAVRAAVADLQRLGPIRIDARVDVDPTATTAAAAALRDLQTAARGTGRSLATLTARAATATAALVALGAAARTLRGDMDDLDGSIRRTGAGMVGLRGTLGTVTTAASGAGRAMSGAARAALLLAPALIPIAAQALPIAASMGAATAAMVVFGVAVGGQVVAISEAAEAEKKYNDAVKEHGANSQEAGQAQLAYARTVADMPAPTQRAAAALSSLKDQYKEWSNSLAGDTMPVATKAFQTFSNLFPKLTPVVQGASGQLDRFVTIVAGGIASPGFDRFMASFAEFSTGVLDRANDALLRFVTNINAGQVSGGVSTFMEYARQNGPLVRDTLSKLGEAVGNILEAAANAGPGLLTLVNALAGLVAAVPPGVITAMLQLSLAIKAVSLATAGGAAIAGRVAAIGASITAMRTAASGTPGVIAGVVAAIGSLSRAAKVGLAGTAVGLLVIGLSKLADIGRAAPPDVDKLTVSLGRLGSSGKVSGEAARVFGDDLDNLYDKVRNITDPSFTDQVQNGFVKIFTLGQMESTASTEAQENLDAIDDSLTSLVQGGKIKEAGAALDILAEKYSSNADEQAKFRAQMDEEIDALDAHNAELDIAARAMGAFGEQAQATSAKLAAQKVDADGLREAIIALNDVNRSAYDAEIKFEESIDSLSASFKENGATLDEHTKAGQENGKAMSAAAKARDEMIVSGVAANESLASMTKKSETLRAEMMRLATDAFGGNTKAAKEYVDMLLGTPESITTAVKLEQEKAVTGLQQVQAEIKRTPDAKSITVSTLNAAAIAALEAVGYKTEQLPDGKTQVTTANGQAIGSINAVSSALNRLDGKTAKTFVTNSIKTINEIITNSTVYRSVHDIVGATGGLFTGRSFKRGYADGGLVGGPGTETSDDVFAPWLSRNEFVVNAASARKYLPLLVAINKDRMSGSGAGGMAGRGHAAGGMVSTARTAPAGSVTVNMTLQLTNQGVIGSQLELDNWLTRSLDNLSRTGRLPRALTAGV